MRPLSTTRAGAALCAALLAALCAGLAACSRPQAAAAAAPAPEPKVSGTAIEFPGGKAPAELRVAAVAPSADATLVVPGRLTWDEDRTARVYAPYAGRIDRIQVALGQAVRRGQALALVGSSDIGQAQADLHKAQADIGVARAAAERSRELAEAGVIARKDLLQSQADLARAEAEAERARARLLQYGVPTGAVTQGMALTAPLDGIVVERNVNAKLEVRTDVQGQPLFVISDPTSMTAVLDVDEKDLAAFHVGQPIELHAAAWPETAFAATVALISESVDPTTRTVKVRARVANPDRRLKAEMFVSASVARPAALPSVAADAVLLKGERLYVFVQSGAGRFDRREIRARSGGPQAWLVSQGLAPGDQVVVGGALYLDQMLDGVR